MDEIINRLANRDNSCPSDYEKDGIRYCGICHKPKTAVVPEIGSRLIPVACDCEKEASAKERADLELQQFLASVAADQERFNITDNAYKSMTFERDDKNNRKVSDACRRYVDNWEQMKEDNTGILFYGTVGTGKTFYGCSIVNALLAKKVRATVTNFPRLLNLLQTAKDRQGFIDHLQTYDLLVIDDLGVERDSTFAAEQVFNVIDARARSGLPLIITTNLTLKEMREPGTMQYKRIYDRVLEMCFPVKMVGDSRRAENAKIRVERAKQLLGFE